MMQLDTEVVKCQLLTT